NDAQAAATALRPLVNALPAGDVQEPAVIPFVPDAIQALITVGDLATAGPALEWLEHRGRELDRPWALATAGRCRALFRAATGEELARLGLHRPAGPGLTPREDQVAEHAAAGATNNQIAGALYISPKTVEANLARIYRKLGISSRAELGAWMAARRRGSM